MLLNKKYVSVQFSESKLKERNRELSILFEISNFLAASMTLKKLLEGVLAKVMQYFDMEAGRIYLMDDEERYLNLVACKGIKPEGLELIHLDEGFSGKAAKTRSFIAQYVSELEDKNRAALLAGKGIKIIMCVPLISMNKVCGVMNLATSRIIKLDQNKIDLLSAVGNQIANAANNNRLFEKLIKQIEMIKEKEEMIKFFAYSASHDLKSPATAVYALADRLQQKHGECLDEKGKMCCEQILKTAKQIALLVDKINMYIAAKEAPSNLERVKIKEITETIKTEFSTRFEKRDIRWSEPDSLPEIVADKLSLIRVFSNFIDNSLKYGGDDLHEIKMRYEEDDSSHIFSFSDDGVGIKEEAKEKIFEIFKRDETARGKPGSGLGLAIVKEIAASHKGRVWLDTDQKKGVVFYFSVSKNLKETKGKE